MRKIIGHVVFCLHFLLLPLQTKVLMVSRINKIPLRILGDIKWDLGLPEDYAKSIVPEFPDCFRVVGNKNLSYGLDSDLELELVCWKAMRGKMDYKKGKHIAFPMQLSKGFEMDKQLKKWFDDWQKLHYISPYENAAHLQPRTYESDKEHCFTIQGYFYLLSKMGTDTVVLREAYKRGLLLEKNPPMSIRSRYIHLMNTVTEDKKAIGVPGGTKQEMKSVPDSKNKETKMIAGIKWRQRLVQKHHGMTNDKLQSKDPNRDRLTSLKSKGNLLTERRTAAQMKT
ncbi:hypothetical protein P3X46_028336 [Hevea brasiliensis]|uniref:PORR domain-containing protein n=1 Tax=Hevea brasiliensis TaxID=3981 RepID=A0ABQ9KQG1_HEVBR|nr:hypothetical protein P3X46_028336 [Hevea brasiliensis]